MITRETWSLRHSSINKILFPNNYSGFHRAHHGLFGRGLSWLSGFPSFHIRVLHVLRRKSDFLVVETSKVEYRALANVVAESSWLRSLLHELGCPTKATNVVFCDNVNAMHLSANPSLLARSAFYMFLQQANLPTFSQKGCHHLSSMSSDPVSAFENLQLRLWGRVRIG
ncbi:hypothetical protein V2J09_012618 [Rumex salicifolius]